MAGSGVPHPAQGIELPVVNEALKAFEAKTDGDVTFGPEAALLYPGEGEERPTSQPAEVRYLNQTVGSLRSVIFNYYDGTGDRAHSRVEDSTGDGYFMEGARIVPWVKEAIHGDIHLAIASFEGRDPEADQRMLAGSLSLFGQFGGLIEIGYLGQDNAAFHGIMSGQIEPEPTATKTVNPHRLDPAFSVTFGTNWQQDVRAVYSRYMGISQIAAFITLERGLNGQVTRAQAAMIERLGAREPVPGQPYPRPQPLQRR